MRFWSLGLIGVVALIHTQGWAATDDSDLSAEEMAERLALPQRLEELKMEPGTRGFEVRPATRLSLQSVNFKFDSAVLTDEANAVLRTLAEALQSERLAGRRFLIAGHTDAAGDAVYNSVLSERRAESVRLYLTQLGIDSSRLDVLGRGEDAPLEGVDPGDASNRRVEVIPLDQPGSS